MILVKLGRRMTELSLSSKHNFNSLTCNARVMVGLDTGKLKHTRVITFPIGSILSTTST
jgi:hypothetical protein